MAYARRGVLLAWLAALVLMAACSGGDTSSGGSSDVLRYLQVNADGLVERGDGKERLLVSVSEGSYVNGVAVSPDNKRLAFILQPPASVNAKGDIDFGTDIYVSDRDGRNRQEVLRHGQNGEFFYAPFWRADGQSLIYVVRGRDAVGLPDFRLESLELRSGNRQRLIEHAVDVGLAPDGKTVVYVHYDPASQDGEKLLLTELGSSAKPVTLVPAERGLLLMGSPVFSPDGSRIAFAASSGMARNGPLRGTGGLAAGVHPTLQDLWLVNRDGSDLRLLAEIVESQPSVDWSPDGKQVYALGGGAFWRVDVESGKADRIGLGEAGGVIRMLKRP